jgi:hypothetical protein
VEQGATGHLGRRPYASVEKVKSLPPDEETRNGAIYARWNNSLQLFRNEPRSAPSFWRDDGISNSRAASAVTFLIATLATMRRNRPQVAHSQSSVLNFFRSELARVAPVCSHLDAHGCGSYVTTYVTKFGGARFADFRQDGHKFFPPKFKLLALRLAILLGPICPDEKYKISDPSPLLSQGIPLFLCGSHKYFVEKSENESRWCASGMYQVRHS